MSSLHTRKSPVGFNSNGMQEHGWEVDHWDALARGGDNQPANLHAMHPKTNNEKSDRVPMKFGDSWTFQKSQYKMTPEEMDSHKDFSQALNSGTLGAK